MDKWSLLTGGASLVSLFIALYELRRKNIGIFVFFLCVFLVFAILVLHNEDSDVPKRISDATPPVNSMRQFADHTADFRELMLASNAYQLDPDLVKIVIAAHQGSISPPDVAQHLRELLERYNFDLLKALGAYDVGTDRVDQCNCIPDDARQYVADVVKEFNKRKKIDIEVVKASEAYQLDPDLVKIVIAAHQGSISPPDVAQHLRELLERYNFDLLKALGAYDVGTDRVDQCNCIPDDARQYVADVVTEFNKKVRARASAGIQPGRQRAAPEARTNSVRNRD